MSTASQTLFGEEAIVAVLAPLAAGAPGALGLKDDCAFLRPRPGMDIVLKTDPIASGVHFLPDDAPEDVAWKALAVNVSDLAAKGAAPVGYLMALSFPEAPQRAWLERFASGLRLAQERLGCHLLGGDTDRRPGPTTISITVFGEVPSGTMVQRATAKPGDAIFVSGTIGDARLGLELCRQPHLAADWGLSMQEIEALQLRYRRPEPRLGLGSVLRAHASAAMDISDGLAKDLGRLAKAGGVDAEVRVEQVPLSAPARRIVAQVPEWLPALLSGGDDYEILATVPEVRAEAFALAAKQASVPVTRIGTIPSTGPGTAVFRTVEGTEVFFNSKGWDHF